MAAKAKDITAWREQHDKDVIVPKKIQAAIESMRKDGPETWEYESDFIKRAGISQTDMGRYRERFIKHIVPTPVTTGRSARNCWFADAKVAGKLRGE